MLGWPAANPEFKGAHSQTYYDGDALHFVSNKASLASATSQLVEAIERVEANFDSPPEVIRVSNTDFVKLSDESRMPLGLASFRKATSGYVGKFMNIDLVIQ